MTIEELKKIFPALREAGEKIMEIYSRDFDIEYKDDSSPLTEADKSCNEMMMKALLDIYPQVPVLSEENEEIQYQERKDRNKFWLLDPLDGTKEFVKKNGEFCISLGLIEDKKSVAGVIYAPVTKELRYAVKGKGSYKIASDGNETRLAGPTPLSDRIRIVASRSHQGEEMQKYVADLEMKYGKVEFVSKGSALKFCLIAEGLADSYPRLAPTMEWDTAAGDIICSEVGKKVLIFDNGDDMVYGKGVLSNDWFIVV